ncbi:hypothetical protein GC163_06680 [bacterium]|nr:hypothetical protein [bacterium]
MTKRLFQLACLCAWLLAVSAGYSSLVLDSVTPAAMGEAPSNWPAKSRLPRGKEFTVVVFLHPHCACSRATLAELSRLMSESHANTEYVVVFQQPEIRGRNWHETALWHAAAEIPGLRRVVDYGCRESEQFRAKVSGEARVYNRRGELCFRGGLTPSRGHEGTNVGQLAVQDVLNHQLPAQNSCHAFGCQLIQPTEVSP